MQYVKLGFGCSLERVGQNYCILDIINTKTFIISDGIKKKIIKDAIINKLDINSLNEKYGNKWKEFEQELQCNYTIRYSNNKNIYSDSWDYGNNAIKNSEFIKQVPRVKTAYIQINNECKMKCTGCGKDYQFNCMCCSIDDNNYKDEKIDYKVLINNLNKVGCINIVFNGGDPLLDISKMKKIMQESKKHNMKHTIITNGFECEKQMKFLKENKIKLWIQIIDNNEEYLNGIKEVMKRLKDEKIEFLVNIRLFITEDFLNFIKDNKIDYNFCVSVDQIKSQDMYMITNGNLTKSSNIEVNSLIDTVNLCLYSKIYIDLSGKIYNCTGFRSESIGNINDFYYGIFNLKKMWENKDLDCETCKACGLHKVCINCLSVKKNNSTYNKICYLNSLYNSSV